LGSFELLGFEGGPGKKKRGEFDQRSFEKEDQGEV